jgi:hypothetical protein
MTLRITTIGAVCVGFDELSDGQAVGGFARGDGDVLAHDAVLLVR